MKKLFLSLLLVATTFAMTPAAAQQHRHTPRTAAAADTTAVEAFSDTTATDTAAAAADNDSSMDDDDDLSAADKWMSSNGFNMMSDSMNNLFIILVLLIIFVLCPVSILGIIAWIIYKLLRQRSEDRKMAMAGGQPGQQPEQLKTPAPVKVKDAAYYWRYGIRNVSIGLGIAIVGWLGLHTDFITAIGLLLALYGGGQLLISKTSDKYKGEKEDEEEKL